MKNRTKERLLSGKMVLGAQLRFGAPAIAELFGHAGFDYVIFDGEHAPQTPVGIQHQIQALGSTPATPVVRLPKNDPEMMRPYLDMGALGMLIPFINSAEDARTAARAMRYPPVGTRGFGPSRAYQYGFNADYFNTADDEMLFLPMIEDALAVRNIDAILAVDGVDSFIIGPADLSISLGIPLQYDHPKFKDAVRQVIRAGLAAKKPLGTAIYGADIFEAESYAKFVDQGFTLFLAGGDEWILHNACKKLIECVSVFRK